MLILFGKANGIANIIMSKVTTCRPFIMLAIPFAFPRRMNSSDTLPGLETSFGHCRGVSLAANIMMEANG